MQTRERNGASPTSNGLRMHHTTGQLTKHTFLHHAMLKIAAHSRRICCRQGRLLCLLHSFLQMQTMQKAAVCAHQDCVCNVLRYDTQHDSKCECPYEPARDRMIVKSRSSYSNISSLLAPGSFVARNGHQE